MGDQRDGRPSPSADVPSRLIGPVLEDLRPAAEWVLLEDEASERQLYWRQGALHARRLVATRSGELTVYRDLDGRRGKATFTLTGETGDRATVEAALEASALALNPPYRLPTGPAGYPELVLGDEEPPDEEALASWGERLQHRLRGEGVTASHLELFSARHRHRLLSSGGRRHAWRSDSLLTDLIVATGEGEEGTEFRVLGRSRTLSDLLPERVLTTALRAVRDRRGARLPPTGRMPVVLPSGEIAALLEALRLHTSARAVYTKMVPSTVGDILIAPSGDAITATLNPLRPNAPASAPTDASTVPSAPLAVLEAGVIRRLHADPQYAAYLGMVPTGPPGTLEISPGETEREDLLADGPVLEIVAFSANMPDPLTGSFACEIKMGYLHHRGVHTPVAHGSVTGNVLEALTTCRLSRECGDEPGYHGPVAIRFESLQVAGG